MREDVREGSLYPDGFCFGYILDFLGKKALEAYICIKIPTKKFSYQRSLFSDRICPHRKVFVFHLALPIKDFARRVGRKPRFFCSFVWCEE